MRDLYRFENYALEIMDGFRPRQGNEGFVYWGRPHRGRPQRGVSVPVRGMRDLYAGTSAADTAESWFPSPSGE